MKYYSIPFILVLISTVSSIDKAVKDKSKKKEISTDEKLDEVIAMEFKARDADNDGRVTAKEIRSYYESHPDKMSKEGIEFIDKNFNNGKSCNLEEYRSAIKQWLAENGSIEKILVGVFGNRTDHVAKDHVHRSHHRKNTTLLS